MVLLHGGVAGAMAPDNLQGVQVFLTVCYFVIIVVVTAAVNFMYTHELSQLQYAICVAIVGLSFCAWWLCVHISIKKSGKQWH